MVGRIIRYRKECCLRARNLLQTNKSALRHVDPVVVVYIIADGEHGIGFSVGIGSLDQLNIAVSSAEIISIDGANTEIIGAVYTLKQWSNLDTFLSIRE